jgi:DNA-directed RNA polymerase subunit RPC12/RpoP
MTSEKLYECTQCEIEFRSKLKDNGFLPDCPECGIDYRVFEVEEAV